ncbi:MAG: transcription elongation factor GreA, partial [Thermoleophilia bacterium]|nr:transcription elongation factor GreA [Thermoleophilia bacterium]
MTPLGYARLRAQLELLRTNGRSQITEQVADARRDGGLADNPALAEALEEQAQLEARIAELER